MIKAVYFILLFGIAAGIAYLLTPQVIKFAKKWRVLDMPNTRKTHEGSIPSMGGLAIFIAFFATLGLCNLLYSLHFYRPLFPNVDFAPLFLGAVPLLILGILDDKYRLNYKAKLLVQIPVLFLVAYFGYRIYGITNPLSGETVFLGALSIPVTVFWFLFIINAINLIDGVDGLAAGVSLIASVTVLVVANYLGNFEVVVMATILAGSIAGFFRYNFSPASIFMGDTGSIFLGFMLAVLSMLGASQKSSIVVAIMIPIAILGLPIIDAIFAVIRRWSGELIRARSFRDRLFAWKNVFFADRKHIHHRLLDAGITKRSTVIILYLISLGFGMIGFFITIARYQYVALILLYMGVVFFIAFRKFPFVNSPFPPVEKLSEPESPKGDPSDSLASNSSEDRFQSSDNKHK